MAEKKKIDKSLLISVVALLISLGTMAISIIETDIMKGQQKIMMDQKYASVWPYMQRDLTTNYGKEESSFSFAMENKGVGPALIKDVTYLFKGDTVETWTFYDSLTAHYPSLEIPQYSNRNIDDLVMSPGQNVTLVKFRLNNTDSSSAILNTMQRDFKVSFCYCSIYGECWYYADNEVVQSDKCEIYTEVN